MKLFVMILFIYSSISFGAGGDLGGGGIARFQLTPEEKELLVQQPTVEEAFQTWKQLQDKKKQQQLMKDVFETHIIQQLTE